MLIIIEFERWYFQRYLTSLCPSVDIWFSLSDPVCFVGRGKLEYRAVINFRILGVLSLTKIRPELVKLCEGSDLSFSVITKRAATFDHVRILLEDNPSRGRSKTATTNEYIEKLENMILDDRRAELVFVCVCYSF